LTHVAARRRTSGPACAPGSRVPPPRAAVAAAWCLLRPRGSAPPQVSTKATGTARIVMPSSMPGSATLASAPLCAAAPCTPRVPAPRDVCAGAASACASARGRLPKAPRPSPGGGLLTALFRSGSRSSARTALMARRHRVFGLTDAASAPSSHLHTGQVAAAVLLVLGGHLCCPLPALYLHAPCPHCAQAGSRTK